MEFINLRSRQRIAITNWCAVKFSSVSGAIFDGYKKNITFVTVKPNKHMILSIYKNNIERETEKERERKRPL